ncbi:MAG: binding-protein-dependent transport system inner membrane protein [Bacillota bacterium]|nr:MAG: binding-protein-dependent transport system inner membrane protein [Bacillota bacterium]
MNESISRRKIVQAVIYALLIIGSIVMLFPFVWMLSTSFKLPSEVYDLNIVPKTFTLDNYRTVLTSNMFGRWFVNSLLIAVISTVTTVFFASMVGYAFAKKKFPGQNFFFLMILSSLMVPVEMLIIPWYITAVKYGWTDSYWGIMFPGLITAFGVFLMKQFMEGVPTDMLDAARIDGMSELGIWWHIAMPQVRSALAALGIFTFLGTWNAFLWPVIIIDSPHMRTLPVGISLFATENAANWHLSMTAAAIALIPVLVVFAIFQKHIIEGITITGMKG